MITHWVAAGLCRRASVLMRDLANGAVGGRWVADDAEDSWSLHVADSPYQIVKAPKRDTPFAEYWPDAGTGAHIASWSQMPALAVADLLEHAANGIDALAKSDPDADLPPLLSMCARAGEAFLQSQPSGEPDSIEEIQARLVAMRAERDARRTP